jgi:hypothetical protein
VSCILHKHHVLLLFLIALFLLCSDCSDKSPAAPHPFPGPDAIFTSDSLKEFIAGVNWPWQMYGHDFGQANWPTGSWSHDGISSPKGYNATDSQFALCRSNGIRFLRCFLFCDGRASPEFDSNGTVMGFDNYFFADMDSLLSLSNKHGIRLILVLFDYSWLDTASLGTGGVKLGGHSDIIKDSIKSNSFFDSCLSPLISHCGTSRTILAWEIMNEPEWRMSGYGGTYASVTTSAISSFFNKALTLLHSKTTQYVTLGSAKADFLQIWTSLDFDFYQIHCYDKNRQAAPFYPKTSLNCSKPILIGEFPTSGSTISLPDYLDASWNYGYAGAFAWGINAIDGSASWTNTAYAVFNTWIQSHKTIMN